MSTGQSISKQVGNLVRDRLNHIIDDNLFKQKLKGILSQSHPHNIGLALAKHDSRYLYLLTDSTDREIASWVPFDESDWTIAMGKWGRGKLIGDKEIKRMLSDHLHLQSPLNKTVFEQGLKEWIRIHKGQSESKKYLREELVGALLDFFFALADGVDTEIQRRFKMFAGKMTK